MLVASDVYVSPSTVPVPAEVAAEVPVEAPAPSSAVAPWPDAPPASRPCEASYADTSSISTCSTTNRSSAHAVAPPSGSSTARAVTSAARHRRRRRDAGGADEADEARCEVGVLMGRVYGAGVCCGDATAVRRL